MVNYAARVVGAISEAQIWLSDQAYADVQLEKAKFHKDLVYVSHTCELKGFREPQKLWEVQIAKHVSPSLKERCVRLPPLDQSWMPVLNAGGTLDQKNRKRGHPGVPYGFAIRSFHPLRRCGNFS